MPSNAKEEIMSISYEIYSKDNEITKDEFWDKVVKDDDFSKYFDEVLWEQAKVIYKQRQTEYNNVKTIVNPPHIKPKYKDVLNEWDVIIDKKLFHEFNKGIPTSKVSITYEGKHYTITEIVDDGESYLINWTDEINNIT
jgi:hypothetical protein